MKEIIFEKHIDDLNKLGLRSLKIRSALTCETEDGICANVMKETLLEGLTNIDLAELLWFSQ